ncbi:MAG: alpha-amylase family glycosyl hydrolase [Bacteroidales bacterium]|nr:alpha-amylase family glycosyl hydrolase [Bacteroidales bacterium]
MAARKTETSILNTSKVLKATSKELVRVEPLSWWIGMKTDLQLLIGGDNISDFDVCIIGGKGVRVTKVTKADSPNYLFVDVDIDTDATPGTYYLVFSNGEVQFRYPYQISAREEGSSQRKSFTTADMIYLVFPDRFADADPKIDGEVDRDTPLARHGGDIKGIIKHLDYISGLGATAIWSTPLLVDNEIESYHGYACGDYYHIDPRFGTNELYRQLCDKAHEKGLKMIMDIVTNHCGTRHWRIKDMPFKDWVHVFDKYTGTINAFSTNMDPNASWYDLNLQESGWFVPSMPDMNLDNPYVLKYFQQWAVWWIEYAGLDGLSVDTYPYNEKDPMSRWCACVRAEYPNINIVGECWTASHAQLAYWQGDNGNKDGFNSNLPSIMDFPLRDAMEAAICESGDNPEWGRGMTRVYDCLSHDFVYHDLSKMMIFIANHDHARMGDTFNHNPDKMKIALTLVATLRGIPQLYNGDEMMFSHKIGGDWSDGSKRIDFPGGWKGDKVNLFTKSGRKAASSDPMYEHAEELYNYTSKLFNWRKTKEVIHSGRTMHFLTRDNTYAFFRYNDKEVVFVYVNNSYSDKTIPWNNYAEIASSLTRGRNVITGMSIRVNSSTVVPAMSTLIVEYTH